MSSGHSADLGPADLADGELREATAEGLSLVVAWVEGRYVAFETWCSHEECPLSDGWLEGEAIRCACHGALFSLTDGAALEGPALDPIVVVGASVTADGRVVADISTSARVTPPPRCPSRSRAAQRVGDRRRGVEQLRRGSAAAASDRIAPQGPAHRGATRVTHRRPRGARGRTARARRVDRAAAASLLRVRRLVGARGRRARRSARLVLRREHGRLGGSGDRDRGSGDPLGRGVRRLPGRRGSLHERRHGVEHDRARGGARARSPRFPTQRARERVADDLLLGRGALLDRARGRAPRHRVEQRAIAPDRRRPASRPRGSRGGDQRGSRRRPDADRRRSRPPERR